MTVPTFTMRQLLESGVHFGHHTRRWNPRMAPYIFGVRNGVHIIDLQQTVPLLYRALEAIRDTVGQGGRVLFVGTKRSAQERVADVARSSGQYFVNHRWLGGMLTNWKTISQSIKRLKDMDEVLTEQSAGMTKKERLKLTRERDALERALGGIREMGGLPNILVIIDTNKEALAVAEAKKLNIPVVAVLDSNSDPAGITFPIPGNDDALRAIDLYCSLFRNSVAAGLEAELTASGVDIGALDQSPDEPAVAETAEAETGEAAMAEPEATEPSGDKAAAEPSGDTAAAEPSGDKVAAEPSGDTAAAEPSGDKVAAEPENQAATEPPAAS